jgi:diguanylate cyclase (GGDEF)-like protein/PAS domain S-box-containing protein
MEPTTTAKPEEQSHRLLRRQIKRYLGDRAALPPSWQSMLGAVNEAYLQFESDYALLERSLELSSQELRVANSGMRAMYERLIQSSMDGIFAFDQQGCCTVWNPGMEQFTGVTQLQAIGKSLFDLFPSLEKTTFGKTFRMVLAGETVYNREVHAAATPYFLGEGFLECSFAPLLSESGAIIGGLGVLHDVTQRKLAEGAMRKQHDSLAALQEMALRLTSTLELQELLTDILDRACLLMETPHAFLGLVEPESSAMVIQFATGTMKNAIGRPFWPDEQTLIAEVWRTHAPVVREHYPGLSEFQFDPLHSWVVVPLLKGSDVIGVMAVAYTDDKRQVAENEVALLKQFAQLASIGLVHGALNEANARLVALATTDALTDLPNRTRLLERIEEGLPRAEQRGGQMALLMLDIDRFKEVNDTFGHQCGDHLLQQVGKRLGQAVDATATVARLGGDEFAVFLPTADEEAAREVASAISAVLEESFLVEDSPHQIEASIGIALYPRHGTDPLTLFRHADVAMYLAKRRHEGCALYDAQQDQYSPRRLALLGDLRRAIASEQLRLYYQPKADLCNGLVKSVEALVRWQHPTHGFIPPDQFIPLAEQTGLITPLTHWVVETAVTQCRRWLDCGLGLSVAVNLSMWNLRDASLPETIAGLLAQYQVPPRLLCVEITESAVMTDAEHTLQVLQRLFALGVRIAIDDYGTGYASLSYLKRLPADELKIDRAFVKHMTTDPADQAIVRSTVNMAHSLGIHVVAEGVEDQETWSLLGILRCDIAQGYYLSRPVAAHDLERWLGERQGSFPHTANTSLGSETAMATA